MCPMHVHLYAGGKLLKSHSSLTVWIKAAENCGATAERFAHQCVCVCVCVCVLQVSFGCQ